MKQNNVRKESFSLSKRGVDTASTYIGTLLEEITNQRDGLRIRLAAEEVMRFWSESLGEDTCCAIWCASRFGQRSIRLAAPGPGSDPNLCREDSELEAAGNIILERLGMTPLFRYEKGVNLVTFQINRKKPNQLVWIGLAAVLALIFGLASLSLPEGVQSFLSKGLATPVLQMLFGMLTAVAMPLVFFSISTSIMDIGDVVTFGKLGKNLIVRFLTIALATSTLTIFAVAWLFPVSTESAGGSFGFEAILSLVFSIVPTNIVSPFLESNTMQLIFLGGCIGVAFLVLGERVQQAADIFRQLDRAACTLMTGINRLIPLFVFLTFFTLVTSGTMSRLGGTVKIIILAHILFVALVFVFTAAMSLHFHVAPRILLQKMGPAFLVALTTASTMASYPIRLETCKKRLGIDEHTAHFAVPLAQVLCKPAGCGAFSICALCVAEEYGVPITPGWLVLCAVVTVLLTIAAPPVPGGSKISYTALLIQLGIPTESLVLILAADAVIDFGITAMNAYAQMVLTAICADELGLLNRAVLAAPDKS